MTEMNGVPTPGGNNPLPGGQPGQPASSQPAPAAAYQPYGAAHQAQPHGGQHAYAGQPYAGQTYEAEPVATHAQHAGQKSSGGKTFLIAFAGALVACVLAFGVWGAVGAMGGGSQPAATVTDPTTGQTTVITPSEDSTLAEAVAAKCLPSVVAIDVYAAPQQSGMGGWEQLFGYDYGYGTPQDQGGQELQLYSQGSGVVLTEDGYIITNNHVVEGGSAYKVTVAGETYDAELVGTDASSDVAVLKAKDAKGLTVMEIGDSDNLTIGEWVMTLGSPFGLEQSVATGIVSATSRSQIMDASESAQAGGNGEITIYPNMIQTDAAINPGNSGGALVDDEGKLIGINTLITSYSGNYSGVGFAIPVNYAINLAQQIIAGETPTHAQLGVSLSTVSAQLAQRYGLAVDTGAYVAGVAEGSGAAAAGIVPGDIITAFDGQPVESASDLMLDVRTKNPGDTVTLTVNSAGQEKEVQVTLGDDAASQQEAQTQQESMDVPQGGMSIEDMLRQYGQQQERDAA
ncbi:trypsin-like peptidase domain-containing protein [Adlercreutzia sp. R21]|uniref:S1C family serine protease n=1 Tax=Adlercreutzia wanghongyangiae TaxID=3111451 RepID=UPI002DBC74A9|nr:trypsin-like peptidase domain-containing protein [Adlercreutzia sp. R21]MEC4185345.1 trypsin-like peptidase domain-containing protein [Adlercreutzia sp. R21]